MKRDIKILKIAYIIIFLVGFLLYFNYVNQDKAEITPSYTYEILNIDESYDEITYQVKINEPYKDEILKTISEEIKKDYEHLYDITDVNEKVVEFKIEYYFNDELFKQVSNKKQ